MTVQLLTSPQVATTLLAFQTHDPDGRPLLDEVALNAVLVMLVTTSIFGPMLTQR